MISSNGNGVFTQLTQEQLFREFTKIHGDHVVASESYDRSTGNVMQRLVYQDGSVLNGMSAFPPSPDPLVLARTKLEFINKRLEQEEAGFRQFQSHLRTQALYFARRVGPPPPADAVQRLEAGAERIRALRETKAELEIEAQGGPQVFLARIEQEKRAAAADAEHHAAVARLAQEIDAVSI